jgi:hypothetical protein
VKAADQLQVLDGGEVGVQLRLLGYVSDQALVVTQVVCTSTRFHPDGTERRPEQADQHPDGGALAGPVRSQQSQHPAGPDREGQSSVTPMMPWYGPGDVSDFEHRGKCLTTHTTAEGEDQRRRQHETWLRDRVESQCVHPAPARPDTQHQRAHARSCRSRRAAW